MFNFYDQGVKLTAIGFIIIIFTMFCWWQDVLFEANIEGKHTKIVQSGLRLGVVLFIVSEVMFFFSFF